jgi:hypothetical protein
VFRSVLPHALPHAFTPHFHIGTIMRSMTPAAALSALALALVARAAPSFVPPPLDSPVSAGFPYGSQKVRGVNLGGWLVMEVRICPIPRHVPS